MESKSWFKNLTPYFGYILLVSTIGPLLFGFHLAELNAPQSIITCEKKSISSTTASLTLPQCIPMNSTQFGLVSSIFTLGGLLGALVAGPLSARYGRHKSMLMSTVPFILGPAFEALAIDIPILVIGRLISGLGAGASVVIAPIFISEIAPPGEKGFFGAFTQIMINMGIFIAQLLGLFLSKGSLWRIILAVGGAIAVAQAIGLAIAGQESPKWLADHGQERQANRVLRKLRGHEADIQEEVEGWVVGSSDDMADERDSLLTNQDRMPSGGTERSGPPSEASATQKTKEAVKALGALAVLKNPDSRPAVIAVVVIMIGQQLCGINSIVMYGVSLLSDLLSANSALLNVLVAVMNIIVTTSCAPLTDKLGRKVCLIASIFGMGLSSLLLAVGIMKHIPILSAITVLTFVASFGLGLGPVPFILSSELVGPSAVGATQSWALAANWIATFVVAQFFPIVNEKLGQGKVYFIFAAFAALLAAFVYWAVPETKGKADADEVWGRKAGRAVD